MRLFLSVHAVKRMASRGIERAEIEQALELRQTEYPSTDDDSALVVLGVTNAGRRLKVIVRRVDESYVITVAGRGEEG